MRTPETDFGAWLDFEKLTLALLLAFFFSLFLRYLGMSDVIILSTEDNKVMDEAAKWNEEHPTGTQWQFTYLNDKKVNNQHVISVARWHFVNAFMAAQADAFIITTGSNWCRVINELRKTRGKLNYALGDLEPGEWKRSIEAEEEDYLI